jgi:LemA protein
MSRGQIVMLAAVAVLVLWTVGAYNRLVALRNTIKQAWSKVDEALRLRAAAADPLLEALRLPLAAEQGALDRVQAAQQDAARTAAVMAALPVVQAHASAWVSAEAALAAAASRVFALADYSDDVRQNPEVQTQAQAWRDAQARLVFARQVFNEAAEEYNAAIALFPTRLLVPMFRFGAAGHL